MEIYIQNRGDYQELLEISQWAEGRGIKRIGVPDHYIIGEQRENISKTVPALDLFTAVAGLIRETQSIAFATLVSPITFRHPAVMAKMASTINNMGPKRFSLGIGTGWLEVEHSTFGFDFPTLSTRFEMLEEALIYVKEVLSGNNNGFEGRYYQLEKFPIEPVSSEEVKIIVGGGGLKKTPTLAGKYADEYNIYASPEGGLSKRIQTFSQVAEENGRNISDIEISTACPPVVAMTYKSLDKSLIRAEESLMISKDKIINDWKERQYLFGLPSEIAEIISMWKNQGISSVYLQLLDTNSGAREETYNTIKEAVKLVK